MEEKINLIEFVKSGIVKLSSEEKKLLEPIVKNEYMCPICKKNYSKEDKFCSKDGEKIVEKTYESTNEEMDSFIINFFYSFQEGIEIPKKSQYTYIESIEKRGDGSGYHMNYIFQRKSDEKYFYFSSYDGRIENKYLSETTKKVKVVWDFERYYS